MYKFKVKVIDEPSIFTYYVLTNGYLTNQIWRQVELLNLSVIYIE
jgi:hypothetical protein